MVAKQVRPGLTNPARFKGRQESDDLIRRQPAYSIRARGQAPHNEAECMAAISTCFNQNGKSAWQRGAPGGRRLRASLSSSQPFGTEAESSHPTPCPVGSDAYLPAPQLAASIEGESAPYQLSLRGGRFGVLEAVGRRLGGDVERLAAFNRSPAATVRRIAADTDLRQPWYEHASRQCWTVRPSNMARSAGGSRGSWQRAIQVGDARKAGSELPV